MKKGGLLVEDYSSPEKEIQPKIIRSDQRREKADAGKENKFRQKKEKGTINRVEKNLETCERGELKSSKKHPGKRYK